MDYDRMIENMIVVADMQRDMASRNIIRVEVLNDGSIRIPSRRSPRVITVSRRLHQSHDEPIERQARPERPRSLTDYEKHFRGVIRSEIPEKPECSIM